MASINESFEEITNEYIDHLKSLIDLMPMMVSYFVFHLSSNVDKLKELNEKRIASENKTGKSNAISYGSAHIEYKIIKDINKTLDAVFLLQRNMLVSLVCSYDALVSRLIKLIYKANDNLLKASNKPLVYKDILKYENFESLRDSLIEKETEDILRESHSSQLKKISKLLDDTPLTIGEKNYPQFVEITERRNLFVHSGGIVSDQYLKNCASCGIQSELKIGEKLEIDATYIQNAFLIFFEFGIKLSQVIWRKIGEKESVEKADSFLVQIIFDFLCEKRYDVAELLLSFATEKSTKHPEKEKEYLHQINKALCFYLKGDKEKCRNVINQMDFSIACDRYVMAKYILLEQFDEAAKYIVKLKNDDDFSPDSYAVWPIYRTFIQQDVFRNTYKKVYGREFEHFEYKETTFTEVVLKANDMIKKYKEYNSEEKFDTHKD